MDFSYSFDCENLCGSAVVCFWFKIPLFVVLLVVVVWWQVPHPYF